MRLHMDRLARWLPMIVLLLTAALMLTACPKGSGY